MCIVFLALGQHPDFPVVVAHNRDEFLERRAERMELRNWGAEGSAAASTGSRDLLAGRDVRAGGTWLGLRRPRGGGVCRFATVLNNTSHKEPSSPGAPSRGTLPVRFLLGPDAQSPADFARALRREAATEEMAGFSLLCASFGGPGGAPAEASFVRNRAEHSEASVTPTLGPGVHVLCNDATLESDWGRVQRGRRLFREALRAPGPRLRDELFERLLLDRGVPDPGAPASETQKGNLPLFAVPEEEGELAHGTRASTVVLCSRGGAVQVAERCFDAAHGLLGEEVAYLSSGGEDAVAWRRQPASEAPPRSRL